jgi:hypothetical protein
MGRLSEQFESSRIPIVSFCCHRLPCVAALKERAKNAGRGGPRHPPEQMRRVLKAAVTENPPPSLYKVARRLDYRTCPPLRWLDLVSRIASSLQNSARVWSAAACRRFALLELAPAVSHCLSATTWPPEQKREQAPALQTPPHGGAMFRRTSDSGKVNRDWKLIGQAIDDAPLELAQHRGLLPGNRLPKS